MAKLSSAVFGFIREVFGRDQKARDDLSVAGKELTRTNRYGMQSHIPGLDMMGMGNVSEDLKLDRRLLYRYADYEEMDSYPDLSCLSGDSLIYTLEWGWRKIRDLAEHGGSFHVLSYDKDLRSLVPAKADKATLSGNQDHEKPMVSVVMDDGREIRCTEDHLFMMKDETWKEAKDLKCGDRLMPGVVRIRNINSADSGIYWQVHQPNHGSQIRAKDGNPGRRWMFVHRLVGMFFLEVKDDDTMHHVDNNSLCNAPSNLEILDRAEHAKKHIAKLDNSKYFPEWTEERRLEMSRKMKGNTYCKGKKLSEETKRKMSQARKGEKKSKEWKQRIGLSQPNRMDIPKEKIEAALIEGGTIANAARLLKVSWSTIKRKAEKYDLLDSCANHRVDKVEKLNERDDIYDISVPVYHNFVCNGVVVHNSALDIYADDSSQVDSTERKSVWINCKQENIKNDLETMMRKKLDIEDEVWGVSRGLCHYGNEFDEILVSDNGVEGLRYLPAATMRRVQSKNDALLGFAQSYSSNIDINPEHFKKMMTQKGSAVNQQGDIAVYEPWRVVHMRLQAKRRQSVFGWSVLEPARWVWKRLMLLEDSLLVYRLTRSPSRYAFYVDVGNMSKHDAEAAMQEAMHRLKKKKFVNPKTGKLDFRYSPLSFDEDFFLAMRDGREQTRVDVLNGPAYQHVEDVDYFRNKLYAAIKVPKAYMGYDENQPSRATLSSEDVRFGRTILRVQRELRNGLHKICRVHLAARKIDPAAVDFEVEMTAPSAIFELGQMEVRNARANLASMMQAQVSLYYLLTKVYGMSDDEAAEVMKQRVEEAKAMGQAGAGFEGREIITPDGRRFIMYEQPRSIGNFERVPISEREMMVGNREDEKRMEASIRKVMADPNNALGRQLRETGYLLRELSHSMRATNK